MCMLENSERGTCQRVSHVRREVERQYRNAYLEFEWGSVGWLQNKDLSE